MLGNSRASKSVLQGGEVTRSVDSDADLLSPQEQRTFDCSDESREEGSRMGNREAEKLATLSGMHLRTCCFCNPGACAKYLGLSQSDLISN